MVAEEVMAFGDAASAGSGKVGCVGERAKNNFRGAEKFSSVGVGGSVAEEAVEAFHGVGSGRGLLRGQGTGCGQEARVYGTAVVEKVPYSYL